MNCTKAFQERKGHTLSGLVIILVVAFVALAVFDVLAQTFGVDSRPDFEDQRAPVRGLYT